MFQFIRNQKVSSVRLRRSNSPIHGLTLRNFPKSVDFTKLMDLIASHLRQCAISVFPYLDDWLERDLIRSRLLSQIMYCFQIIQSLGVIPNLVRFDTNSEFHVYRHEISNTTEFSQGPSRPRPNSDHQKGSLLQ